VNTRTSPTFCGFAASTCIALETCRAWHSEGDEGSWLSAVPSLSYRPIGATCPLVQHPQNAGGASPTLVGDSPRRPRYLYRGFAHAPEYPCQAEIPSLPMPHSLGHCCAAWVAVRVHSEFGRLYEASDHPGTPGLSGCPGQLLIQPPSECRGIADWHQSDYPPSIRLRSGGPLAEELFGRGTSTALVRPETGRPGKWVNARLPFPSRLTRLPETPRGSASSGLVPRPAIAQWLLIRSGRVPGIFAGASARHQIRPGPPFMRRVPPAARCGAGLGLIGECRNMRRCPRQFGGTCAFLRRLGSLWGDRSLIAQTLEWIVQHASLRNEQDGNGGLWAGSNQIPGG
jgi:hypothetical protein